MREIEKRAVKKILVIHFDAIGDVLRSTPVIRGLKECYPDSHLSFLTFPLCAEILKNNPFVDRTITYDKRGYRRKALVEKAPVREIFLSIKFFVKSLQNEKFDLVINLHSTPHSAILTSLVKAKEIRGHFFDKFGHSSFGDKWSYYLMLTTSTGIERFICHEELYSLIADVDLYFKELLLNLTLKEKEKATSLLKKHKINQWKRIIAFHPGAGWPEKRWSEEKFAALADSLIKEKETAAIFLGSKWERPIVEKIIQQMKGKAIDLTGQTNLREMAALLGQISLLISNDTCATHFAAAVSTPSIILCGPTLIWSQARTGNILIQSGIHCAPCGHGEGCKNHICMEAITPTTVLKAVELREILIKNGLNQKASLLLKDPSFKRVRLYYSWIEKREGLFYYTPLKREKKGINEVFKKVLDLVFLNVFSRIDPPTFSQNKYGRELISPKEIVERIGLEFEFKEEELSKKIRQAEEGFQGFVELTTSAKIICSQALRIVERNLFMPETFVSLLNQLNEIDRKLTASCDLGRYLVNMMIQGTKPPSFKTQQDFLNFCKRSDLLYDHLRNISLKMAETLGEIRSEINSL